MSADLVQDTLSWLTGLLPGSELRVAGRPEARSVDLPYAPEADYRFQLWFYPDGERGITADLIPSRFGAMTATVAFWAWAFELPDFRGSPVELARAFDEQVRLLLPTPTRVHQHRGWLFLTFALERQVGTEWHRVRVCSYLRFTFKALGSNGCDRVYHAGPVTHGDARA